VIVTNGCFFECVRWQIVTFFSVVVVDVLVEVDVVVVVDVDVVVVVDIVVVVVEPVEPVVDDESRSAAGPRPAATEAAAIPASTSKKPTASPEKAFRTVTSDPFGAASFGGGIRA
jgi:hypothetical protein